MPAAKEYRHALGRQACEKARGKKRRAARAPAVRRVHVMGIWLALPVGFAASVVIAGLGRQH
jgi:hypothetical protein